MLNTPSGLRPLRPTRKTRGTVAFLDERFMRSLVLDENGCWLWQRVLTRGYGRFQIGKTNHRAHRWAFERWVGPIAVGLEIDHTCHVRRCVNPAHLEAVLPEENQRRAVAHRRATSELNATSDVPLLESVEVRVWMAARQKGLAYHRIQSHGQRTACGRPVPLNGVTMLEREAAEDVQVGRCRRCFGNWSTQ